MIRVSVVQKHRINDISIYNIDEYVDDDYCVPRAGDVSNGQVKIIFKNIRGICTILTSHLHPLPKLSWYIL